MTDNDTGLGLATVRSILQVAALAGGSFMNSRGPVYVIRLTGPRAPQRKRPRRIAKRLSQRYGAGHYGQWHLEPWPPWA